MKKLFEVYVRISVFVVLKAQLEPKPRFSNCLKVVWYRIVHLINLIYIENLHQGDHEKVKQVDKLVTDYAGFQTSFIICGQTYTRKLDVECVNALSSLAATIHKVCYSLILI